MATIAAIFVGGPKTLRDDRGEWVSSIARKRASGPVRLSAEGFDGDKVAQPYHGGPDAAVCGHLIDHYDFWRNHHGIELQPGHLGENLVLDGIKENDVCVGDVISIGSARVQVSGPRVPCETQARRAGRADWVKLTIRENRTGFYLRVLEAGPVQQGDSWILEARSNPGASIPAINRCLYLEFNPDLANEFAETSALADWWRDQFRERLARRGSHWSEEILRPEQQEVHLSESKTD